MLRTQKPPGGPPHSLVLLFSPAHRSEDRKHVTEHPHPHPTGSGPGLSLCSSSRNTLVSVELTRASVRDPYVAREEEAEKWMEVTEETSI